MSQLTPDDAAGAAAGEPIGLTAPVCICGMHRSGTSMVAKLLHVAGLYLGLDEDLMTPKTDNPDGFWENKRFEQLNDEVLNELGGAWDWPPRPEARLGATGLGRLRSAAEDVSRAFSGRAYWGWKDPRNSLTLPFWTGLFPHAKVLIVVRNPIEVYLSLRRRQYSSMAFALSLWRVYAERSLAHTLPGQRVVTHYDAYFHDPAAEVRRILSLLKMPVTEEIVAHCCAAMRSDLRHNRFTLEHLRDAAPGPDLVDLYVRLCREAAWPDTSASPDAPAPLSPGAFHARTAGGPGGESSPSSGVGDAARCAAAPEPQSGHRSAAAPDAWAAGAGRLDGSVVQRELQRRQAEALRKAVAVRDARIEQAHALLKKAREEVAEARTQLQSQAAEGESLRRQLAGVREALACQLRSFAALKEEHERLRLEHGELDQSSPFWQLAASLRMVVEGALPPAAIAAVVSKGDDELLKFESRTGWHFPRTADGEYAGHHPADSREGIAHLESARAAGAQYLVIPEPARWWLDHYTEFRRHLEAHCPLLVDRAGVGAVFALDTAHAERALRAQLVALERALEQTRGSAKLPRDAVGLGASGSRLGSSGVGEP